MKQTGGAPLLISLPVSTQLARETACLACENKGSDGWWALLQPGRAISGLRADSSGDITTSRCPRSTTWATRLKHHLLPGAQEELCAKCCWTPCGEEWRLTGNAVRMAEFTIVGFHCSYCAAPPTTFVNCLYHCSRYCRITSCSPE